MICVVADTNVYISALMFGGLPGVFLDHALKRAFTLVTSSVLLDELDEKLRGKFGVDPKDARAIRTRLGNVAYLVKPDFALNVIAADPDDNRVLECAVAGKADFIVSGDRHLLRLGSHTGIFILTVRQFMDASIEGT
jgi:putative PIN family toxin of toxin-antitoxin system